MELKNKIVNFLGDSITEGCGTSGEHARFSYLIERDYGLLRANNYGIGGTRFARQTAPSANPLFDLDFCKRVLEMDRDADINVIFGGTNDFGHGDAPIGTFDDRTPDTFYGACHFIMTNALKLYPTATTVILTPTHRLNEKNPRGDNKPQDVAILEEYVKIIREVAEYYSLPVLDLWRMSGLQPAAGRVQELYMPDGLHPNDAGHRILAQRIGNFLLAL